MVHGNVKDDRTPLEWDETSNQAFQQRKNDLGSAALLANPSSEVKLALEVDASGTATPPTRRQWTTTVGIPLTQTELWQTKNQHLRPRTPSHVLSG